MKRYLTDPSQTSFQTEILSCELLANGHYAVVLAETCFFPESGGQLPDRGTINGLKVLDVQETDTGVVVHELTEPVQGVAAGELDWTVRFDHMQHHTGQHVLTRAFIDTAGLPTVGFHMGDDGCTIDLEGGNLDGRAITEAELLANRIIWENRKIDLKTVPVSDLADADLRKSLPAGVEDVRLVDIKDFDRVACCGTHVRRTGELGAVKVLKSEKVKDNIRIYFKAGRLAFRDYQEKHEVVKSLANSFTTSVDGILDKTAKLTQDAQRLRKELKKSFQKLAAYEKESLLSRAKTLGDNRAVVYLSDEADEGYLNLLAASFKNDPGTVVLLGARDGRVILNSPPGLSIDLASALIDLARQAGGNGGGKGGSARVKLPAGVNVKTFLDKVYDHAKNSV